MTILEKLEEYIDKRLSKIEIDKEKTEKNLEVITTADEILTNVSGLINGDVNIEEIHGIDELFKIMYKEQSDNQLIRFQKLISFFKESKSILNRENFPQYQRYIDEYNKVSDEIKRIRGSLEIKGYESYRRINNEYTLLKTFDSIIQNGKIVNHLADANAYIELTNFIFNTDLDPNEKFELIREFSKDTIAYQESLQKIKAKQQKAQVKKNARKITKNIEEKQEINEPDTQNVILSEEDKQIVSKINSIIVRFKNDEISQSRGAYILENDFSIDFRKTVYESNNDMWETIYGDIVLNLYPNLKTENKDYVISIFKYIIDIYERKYGKEETRDAAAFDILRDEAEKINEAYEMAQDEKTSFFMIYNSLSEEDRHNVDSAIYYLRNGQEENAVYTRSIFSIDELKKVQECISFIEAYDEYRDNIENISEFSDISDEELKAYIETIVARVRLSLDLLENMNAEEEINELSNEESIEEVLNEENDNVVETKVTEYASSLDVNTWMTYLRNPRQDETYGMEDIKSLDKTYSDESKIANALKKMYSQTLIERRSSDSNAKIKFHKRKGGLNYEKTIHPYRMRSGLARVAYCEIPTTEKNQEILAERLNANANANVNIILILGLFTKRTSDNVIYGEVNKRITNNIETIKDIKRLFGNDFNNEEDIQRAVSLINEGFAIYDRTIDIVKEKDDGMGEL